MIILRQKSYGITKKIRNYFGKKADEYKNEDENIRKKLLENAKDNNVEKVVSSEKRHTSCAQINGKTYIFINKKQGHNNVQLAHEIGHSYYVSGEGKKKLGGKIHKLNKK